MLYPIIGSYKKSSCKHSLTRALPSTRSGTNNFTFKEFQQILNALIFNGLSVLKINANIIESI